MLKSKLFTKYLVIGLAIASIFLAIAFVTNHLMMEADRKSRFGPRDERPFVEQLGRIAPEQRIQFLQNISSIPPLSFNKYRLIDEQGVEIFATGRVFRHQRERKREVHRYKVEGRPVQYLEIEQDMMPPPRNSPMDRGIHSPFIKLLGIMGIAIFMSMGLTLLIIFLHFKGRTKEIEGVLLSIKNGDLKARMPVTNHDEFGLAMKNFNVMAEEIENLVNRLRQTEATRRVLLSELAHDIRTPLASVKNLIEILREKSDQLSEDKKKEVLDLSHSEISYIARLVEDLLFLGRIEEPSYQRHDDKIDFGEIIDEINAGIRMRYPNIEFKLINQLKKKEYSVDNMLARRLVRNALENAYSFARERVEVIINDRNGDFIILVKDDGPGFSQEELKAFGMKKFSRKEGVDQLAQKRISIGLGAVIMKAIVGVYHGSIVAENHYSFNENKGSGLIRITFPELT